MSKFALSQPVVYVDAEGKEKAAIIVGTRKSVREGTPVERPEKGTAHLMLLLPNGSTSFRAGIPFSEDGSGQRIFRLPVASEV